MIPPIRRQPVPIECAAPPEPAHSRWRGTDSGPCGDDSVGRAGGNKSVLASVADEQPAPEPRRTSERARRRRPARSKVRDRADRP
mgnify:CR=1 FL=1